MSNTWANRVKQSPVQDSSINDGSNILLPHKYTLWYHDIYNKNWNISSYKKLCVIENVSEFWKIYNNFNKLGLNFYHYFLMKENIQPMWEHIENRNGGICSFQMDIAKFYPLFVELNVLMMCNALTDNSNDTINGISISPKTIGRNNWIIIKIWNKNGEHDLAKTLGNDIMQKYNEVTIQYKKINPE